MSTRDELHNESISICRDLMDTVCEFSELAKAARIKGDQAQRLVIAGLQAQLAAAKREIEALR